MTFQVSVSAIHVTSAHSYERAAPQWRLPESADRLLPKPVLVPLSRNRLESQPLARSIRMSLSPLKIGRAHV